MCVYGSSRQTTRGGLSPNGKVVICSSRAWEVVFALALRRVKTPGNLARLRLGAVAAIPSTVSLVTVVFGGGWRNWVQVRAVVRGGGLGTLSGCTGPSWRACIYFRRNGAAGLVRHRCSHRPMSAWTWIIATDKARELTLTMILYRSTVPVLGASYPPSSSGKSCSAPSSSSPSSSSALSSGLK